MQLMSSISTDLQLVCRPKAAAPKNQKTWLESISEILQDNNCELLPDLVGIKSTAFD